MRAGSLARGLSWRTIGSTECHVRHYLMARDVRPVNQLRTVAKSRTKQLPCSECGTLLTVGSNTRKAPRCVECGLARMTETQRQIAEKSGPEYDKWLSRTLEGFAQHLSATHPSPANKNDET